MYLMDFSCSRVHSAEYQENILNRVDSSGISLECPHFVKIVRTQSMSVWKAGVQEDQSCVRIVSHSFAMFFQGSLWRFQAISAGTLTPIYKMTFIQINYIPPLLQSFTDIQQAYFSSSSFIKRIHTPTNAINQKTISFGQEQWSIFPFLVLTE